MFERLIESRAPRRRSAAHSLASIAFHLALGVEVIRATRSVAEPAPPFQREQPILLPAPQEPSPVTRTADAIPTVDQAPAVTFPAPPTPIDGPVDPGPIAPGIPFDSQRFSRSGWPSEPDRNGPPIASSQTFRAEEVDDPVAIVDQPKPVYPPVLQAAGVSGSVDLQFVVDSTGRAEASSWHVLASTNRAFEEPARVAIMATRYRPARIKGRPVRQLVAQRISFSIDR